MLELQKYLKFSTKKYFPRKIKFTQSVWKGLLIQEKSHYK